MHLGPVEKAPIALLGLLLALSACRTSGRPEAHRDAALPEATPPPVPSPAPSLAAPPTAGPPVPEANPPTATPSPSRPRHVLVLGDSLSASPMGGGYLRRLEAGCPGIRIDNLAKGGFMVNQMRRRFERDALPTLPGDYTDLIVFGGVNDLYSDETAGRTPEKIEKDLSQIFEAAKGQGLRVVALTVAPWGGFTRYFNQRRARATMQLNQWLGEQAAEGRIDLVIDTVPVLSCGDPERLCPEYQAPFRDGLHFGREGQARLGDALLAQAFADCPGPPEPG